MIPGLAQRQPALQAAPRADPRRPRRGHHHQHLRARAADHDRRLDRPRGGVHQHPVPRADLARPVRGLLERLPGDRRRPAGGGGQLAVPARQGAVARDPDPAVRAGHRHPQRGAQGPGRPPAGVVRRALDHLGLRPVRGERPLLPGAAARSPTTEDPLEVLEAGGTPDLSELRLHNGTIYRWNRPGLRHRRRRAAPARREPAPRRRPDGRRHDRQRGASTSAWCATSPRASVRCGRRCPSRPPRRTSTSPPSRASTPRSTGRASARCGPPSWCCGGCCRWRAEGLDAWGVQADERDRLLGIIEQRCLLGHQRRRVVRRPDARSAATWTATTPCARRCWTTASACTPTSPSTPGGLSRARWRARGSAGRRPQPPPLAADAR